MWETIGSIFSVANPLKIVEELHLSAEEQVQYKIKLLEAYKPFSVAQRLLTSVIALLFTLVLVIELVLSILGVWFPITLETISIINELEIVGMLGYAFISAVSWYLGGGLINSFKGKNK